MNCLLESRGPRCQDANRKSSEVTTVVILKALLVLVSSSSRGSTALSAVEDYSPLVEAAPTQPLALSILAWAWTNCEPADAKLTAAKVDTTISALCASYKGTDAVTLLDFLSKLLSRLNTQVSHAPSSSRYHRCQ